jgi:hypothetical protein
VCAALKLTLFLLLFLPSSLPAHAQSLVSGSDAQLVNKFLDQETLNADPLNCEIKPTAPLLDFAFRFDVGYVVRCPVKEFDGNESTVLALVRISPESGQRVVLGEAYKLPGASDVMRARTNIRKLKDEFDFSGGFSAGEGRYVAEVLVVDKATGRMCRKRWNVQTARKHREKNLPVTINEHSAVPMTVLPWTGNFDKSGAGLRVTVLLDTAPIFPFATKLRAWDRAFLLSALSSVLAQIKSESVKLIAFNLDQQKQIFREDDFQPATFSDLGQAMRSLELGTVSYEVLQRRQGSLELLSQLANAERGEETPADVVIFMGPHTRFSEKMERELLQPSKSGSPQFFYLEYIPPWMLGAEFPDSIEYLIKAVDGASLKVHSPNELANAMQRIVSQVKHTARKPQAGADPGS